MLFPTLILLSFSISLTAAISEPSNPRAEEETAVMHIFPWSAMEQFTGINPSDYLPDPSTEVDETFSCTRDAGPNRLTCPSVQNIWSTTVADEEGYIEMKGGECKAISRDCCQTVVCAPEEEWRVESTDVTARMWNPLTMRCVMNGKGGIWMENGGGMVVGMVRPVGEQCERVE